MSISERGAGERYRVALHRRVRRLARLFLTLALEGRVVYGSSTPLWQAATARVLASYQAASPSPEMTLQVLADELAASSAARTSRAITATGALEGASGDRARAALDLPADPRMVQLVQQWAPEQMRIIQGLDEAQAQRAGEVIADGWSRGLSQRAMACELSEATGMSLRRATFTARDQVATLSAKITETRSTQAGLTHYRWSTSQDERVRDSHAQREGEVYAWDSPPEGGHPGEDYGCRCVALPIFDP